jgi:hypothetical protein
MWQQNRLDKQKARKTRRVNRGLALVAIATGYTVGHVSFDGFFDEDYWRAWICCNTGLMASLTHLEELRVTNLMTIKSSTIRILLRIFCCAVTTAAIRPGRVIL